MTNRVEAFRWLKDAEACLKAAEKNLSVEEFRVVIQNVQLCIELSTKAVISCFFTPLWIHNPGAQLLDVIEEQGKGLEKKVGITAIDSLKQLAMDADSVAEWHGWSTYGRKISPTEWMAAVDICTKDEAEKLIPLARRSFFSAKRFIEEWFE